MSGVTPAEVAAGAGEWAAYRQGLHPDRVDELGAAWGLQTEPPQSYAVEGFRRLLEVNGPLWVGVAVPSGHAVVVTGLWGDGSPDGTTVQYHDPWPVEVGTANATKPYREFMREYEGMASTDARGDTNVLILHAGGRNGATTMAHGSHFAMDGADDPDSHGIEGPVPPEIESTGAGEALALQAAVRQSVGLQAHTPEYPQASRFEPAGAGHFTRASGRTIDKIVIHITAGGPNINGTIRWFQLPQSHPNFKPVSSHYIVGQDGEVVQMVRHDDIAHHARGANRTTIGIEHVANTRGLDYTEVQYCNSAALVRWLADQYNIPLDRHHIQGHREATRTSKSCPGDFDWDYFMSMVTRQQCFARADMPAEDAGRWTTVPAASQGTGDAGLATAHAAPLVVPIASAIAGASMSRILHNEGDVRWELDQLNGLKHVGSDPANQGSAPFRYGPTIRVPGFKVTNKLPRFLGDTITASFEVLWQHNGRSVGNVAISNDGTKDTAGWGLVVRATIHDDAQIYRRPGTDTFAGIRIRFTYHFDRSIGGDKIAVGDLMLWGDGTWRWAGRWTQ